MVNVHKVVDDFGPKTLGDWVKNFRLKKKQMKRKSHLGGNLRVCAILSSALITAELELRRKQQERFQNWVNLQTKINKNDDFQLKKELRHHLPNQRLQHQQNALTLVSNHQNQHDEINCEQNEAIANLWKCELKDLDTFMRSISSSAEKNIVQISKKTHIEDIEIDYDTYYKNNTQNHSIQVSS